MLVIEGDNVVSASPVDVEGIPHERDSASSRCNGRYIRYMSVSRWYSVCFLVSVAGLCATLPKSRTSHETRGRPGFPRRTFQVQNCRNPWRYQPITVSGLTIASAERQSLQIRERSNPQHPVGSGQARSSAGGALNDTDLASEREDLQLHGGTGSEHASGSSRGCGGIKSIEPTIRGGG